MKILISANEKARIKARQEYEEKLRREIELKENYQNELLMLENKEAELMNKLQKTQNLCRDAYNDLQKVVSNGYNDEEYE